MKSLKKILAVLLISVLAFALIGCGNGDSKEEEPAADAGADDGKTYSLKIGTALTDADPLTKGLLALADAVADETDGKLTIEVYPSSQLGDTGDVLEQAKGGSNVGIIIDTGMLGDYVKDMAIFTAPYIFDNFEEARKFIDTDLFKSWDEELTTYGLRDLGCNWYQGARNFYTANEVKTPADLTGLRVRTMGSEVAQESMKAFGAVPTALAWGEVYSGLQSNAIDCVEAQTSAAYGASLFEVTKHVTFTEHFQLLTALVISEEWYQTLPDEYKEILTKCAIEAGDEAAQGTIDAEADYIAEMEGKGLVFSEVDKAPFIEASQAVYEKMGWVDLKKEIDAALGK
ncbi:MAG: TRAP transporter substrate-binding protein DctP [Clostridiales Family XIII bacterium]|jgi:tripartite ATP-independent transporter DctP family solute receptor|nr:TRAP transporter substrate-binding protein DctP [Clostridiales Family XIII bacterium]